MLKLDFKEVRGFLKDERTLKGLRVPIRVLMGSIRVSGLRFKGAKSPKRL